MYHIEVGGRPWCECDPNLLEMLNITTSATLADTIPQCSFQNKGDAERFARIVSEMWRPAEVVEGDCPNNEGDEP